MTTTIMKPLNKKLAYLAFAALLLPLTAAAQPQPPSGGPGAQGPDAHRMSREERFEKWREWKEKGEGEADEKDGEGHGRFGKAMRMGGFLRFMQDFNTAVQDPYQAVGFAAVGIREQYKRAGKPQDAIPVLEEFLGKTKDQKSRNILLFTLRQIHEESKDTDKVLAVSKQILQENLQ